MISRHDQLRGLIKEIRNLNMTERLAADRLRWATAHAIELLGAMIEDVKFEVGRRG